MSEEQKNQPKASPKPRPGKVHGIAHLVAAAIYSIGGFKRLLQETSARHQFTAFVLVLALLFAVGANGLDYLIAYILFMLLLAVEALNTAIEEIVDAVSPDWSLMARNAKDLGSFAALAIMLAYGGFLVSVLYRFLNSTL